MYKQFFLEKLKTGDIIENMRNNNLPVNLRQQKLLPRINVGCGMSPTIGWRNLDNSLSIFLSRSLLLSRLLYKLHLINNDQFEYIKFCANHNIDWANACKHIPAETCSVEIIYSSHMLEHLDQDQSLAFLLEAKRVLKSGGIIRLALPNIKNLVHEYNNNQDADEFILNSFLWVKSPKNLLEKLNFLIFGFKHHLWMYDEISILKLISKVGFLSPIILKAGETTISDPGALKLNEREDESLYIEAIK